MMRQKLAERQLVKEQEENLKLEAQENEIKEIRENLNFKAQPIMTEFEEKASVVPEKKLTIPKGPSF
jgi:hypothetical protein